MVVLYENQGPAALSAVVNDALSMVGKAALNPTIFSNYQDAPAGARPVAVRGEAGHLGQGELAHAGAGASVGASAGVGTWLAFEI